MTTNDVPALNDLPERLRVHALAKLIGRTSREVIAALAEIGVEARSAQSGVDRKDAEQVITALGAAVPDADSGPAGTGAGATGPVDAPTDDGAPGRPGTADGPAPGGGDATATVEGADGVGADSAAGVDPDTAEPAGTATGRRRTRRSRTTPEPASADVAGAADAGGPSGADAPPADGTDALDVLAPVFAPPAAVFQPPEPVGRRRGPA